MASPEFITEGSSVLYPANVDRWAVVVGISEYEHEGVRNLEFAARDAHEALRKYIALGAPIGRSAEIESILAAH